MEHTCICDKYLSLKSENFDAGRCLHSEHVLWLRTTTKPQSIIVLTFTFAIIILLFIEKRYYLFLLNTRLTFTMVGIIYWFINKRSRSTRSVNNIFNYLKRLAFADTYVNHFTSFELLHVQMWKYPLCLERMVNVPVYFQST